MKISLNREEREKLAAALRANEDCEENSDGSFTVDLYEPEPAISVELYPEDDGFAITAVALMEYSEEFEGYYLSDRIRDEAALEKIAMRIREIFL